MTRIIYASPDALVQYAADRGVLIEAGEATELILRAQDYIDGTYTYKGVPVFFDTAFPRKGLALFDEETLPLPIIQATLQVALMIKNGVALTEGALASPQIKREVIATNKIETEYATNYQASPVQDGIVLASLVRLFNEYELLNAAGSFAPNLTGWRG